MTVSEFCYEHTKVGELIVIRDAGYIVTTVWIDHEDLFSINPRFSQKEIKKDTWGELKLTTEHNDHISVPCHYIDI